jgi:hypothetical protein
MQRRKLESPYELRLTNGYLFFHYFLEKKLAFELVVCLAISRLETGIFKGVGDKSFNDKRKRACTPDGLTINTFMQKDNGFIYSRILKH